MTSLILPDLTDNDLMPFGQHIGKKMANVPAMYLLYILNKGYVKNSRVKKYIITNMDCLNKEVSRIPKR